MAKNLLMRCGGEDAISAVCTDPALPLSGNPCRVGLLTGVAQTDEATGTGQNQGGQNPTGSTSVEFGPHIWSLSVIGNNAGGGSAVAYGDTLYYIDGQVALSKVATAGIKFGIALGTVGSTLTATIPVKHVPLI